ncbi:Cyclic pyranopterin monophosphate synthase [Diplonema papillatum]|nr:Cyclic pyranopterin monophosphate synthase [Diplonema papillatum]
MTTRLGKRVVGDVAKRQLSDTFGRRHDYLRISITERCNLRCQYCMPADGVDLTPADDLMSTAEIVRAAGIFAELGVRKIRLTGGEPLVRRDFDDLARGLATVREKGVEQLCMTTNGINLAKKLPVLSECGITNINISLDTLEAHKFEFVTRRKGFERVLRSIDQCLDAGMRVKVNCVVMRGVNDEEVPRFAAMAVDKPVEVRFIEYMPFNGNGWNERLLVPWMESYDAIEAGLGCTLAPIAGQRGDVSRKYSTEGWTGTVGFITTMTSQFCGTCNRMRLCADGQLKVCLFDANERSLLQPLRSGMPDEDIKNYIASILSTKQEALGGHTMQTLADHSHENRSMIKIGG